MRAAIVRRTYGLNEVNVFENGFPEKLNAQRNRVECSDVTRRRARIGAASCLVAVATVVAAAQEPAPERPLVEDYTNAMVGQVPATLNLDGFYKKHVDALGYPGTRYHGEHILMHEFAHAIMGGAIRDNDPALWQAIQDAYQAAIAAGEYKGHDAATNASEYWAEGTQWWFWSNDGETFDGQRVQSPDDLKAYDPVLYELFRQVYPGHRIPADIYHGRNIPRPGDGTNRSPSAIRNPPNHEIAK